MANEKLNILRLMIESREKELSIRQISRIRKINYKSAYLNVKVLEQEGAITVKRQGNISLCSFSGNFGECVFLAEYRRREELLKDANFKVLYSRFSKINSQFILLLFGSYARKTFTKHSDIDLLLIADNPEDLRNEIKLLPLNIHLTHVAYKDFEAMLKTREQTVVSEAIRKNIILFGIEDYYRLMANAE